MGDASVDGLRCWVWREGSRSGLRDHGLYQGAEGREGRHCYPFAEQSCFLLFSAGEGGCVVHEARDGTVDDLLGRSGKAASGAVIGAEWFHSGDGLAELSDSPYATRQAISHES